MTAPAPQESPLSDEIMRALRQALIDCARAGQTVSYRDLADRVPVPAPHKIHKLTLALEDLIRADHEQGEPLLAALAVSRANSGIPGRGFFQLLSELGRYQGPDQGPDAAACHAREIAAIWAKTSAPKPSGSD